ncbi:Nitrogen regulation protein NR(I) [Fundidesulfovibrio magnetotacticus]|uniref:Nitrogen regulation protein NR(I) n=1 Tax=Fundidesulfovibrio magnetotacticus TaxID=2730080 RepID=A0A6V8M0J9_9BACT|nr:response regulator [Fundidesulfovibrio magnetotacticus]GFK95988.1 Nitrogen regulation protein NR(I) [Fundidesulfovibrio magnetotacticus]
MKPRLLFVDDESKVLDGLRRMLHPQRGRWDVSFRSSAAEAMQALDSQPHDVLVTDLLMPGMDGGRFLEEVHARHPGIIRLVLSGHSGRALALQAARYAHQFLAKPVDSEALVRTLERLLALRGVLTNPRVQELVHRLDTLPALPEVHQRILAELHSQEPDMGRIAALISQDMGLSASMLKLVNSAFFGLRTRVSSPAHAANLLGLDVIAGLVLTVHLFSSFDAARHKGYDLEGLWLHCLNTGNVCRALACAEGFAQSSQDDLYVAGILHDVGKLVLLCHAPDLYGEVLTASRAQNRAVWACERDILGCTHAELGAYLLSLWGFSEEMIRWIFTHHALAGEPEHTPLAAAIVHAANALDHELRVVNQRYERDRWRLPALEASGHAHRLEDWRGIAACVLREGPVNEP